MTAADTMSQQDADSGVAGHSSLSDRPVAAVALLFLVGGAALLLVASLGLAWPETIESLGLGEFLSYGRALPAALNALVFGWLTLALLAFTHHALPRVVGRPTARPMVAVGSAAIVAAGTGVGVVAILLGEGTGGRLLEMPWYADVALLAGFLGSAVAVSATARRVDEPVPVAAWYLVAAPWWLLLSYAAGAIPGMQGAPAEIQSAFTATAVYGLWLAPAAIGGGYHLVSRLVPDARFHPRLGRIGFWSLGFTWVWTAARTLQYGPTPDWLETTPVLFSAGLAVAAIAVAFDFAFALRGRWDEVRGSLALRLFTVGMALFMLAPGHMFLQSLRSSSSVLRFTGWEMGFEYLTVFGAFTLWALAFLVHLSGAFASSTWGRRIGRSASMALVGGILLAVGTRWVAGLQQGYTWLGGVVADTHENFGEGFANAVDPVAGMERLTFVGLAVASAGILLLVAGVGIGLLRRRAADEVRGFDWPDFESLVTIGRGAAFVIGLALVAVFALPANESNVEPTLLADSTRSFEPGSPAEAGRELYIAEGCWYCHTQQVRAIVTDVGLGAVSALGDYAHDPPGTFGVARNGPDLAHAGRREPTNDPAWLTAHLADPRAERPWSTMPAYDHLSDEELTALATYLAGLR